MTLLANVLWRVDEDDFIFSTFEVSSTSIPVMELVAMAEAQENPREDNRILSGEPFECPLAFICESNTQADIIWR